MYAYRCQSLIRLVEDFGTATENHQGGQSQVFPAERGGDRAVYLR